MRVAIAGAGNVGRSIARELIANGHQILLIDRDPNAIKPESVPEACLLYTSGQLAGQRVTDEDHPSFVSGDEMAAVRDRADLDVGEQVTDGRFGAHSSLARSSGTPIRTCPDPGLRQAAAVLRLARSIAYFDDANW